MFTNNSSSHIDNVMALLILRGLFQYPIKRHTIRYRKASKPRDLYLKLDDSLYNQYSIMQNKW